MSNQKLVERLREPHHFMNQDKALKLMRAEREEAADALSATPAPELVELLAKANLVIDNKIAPATKFKELSESCWPDEDRIEVPIRFRDARVAHEALTLLAALTQLPDARRLGMEEVAKLVDSRAKAHREARARGSELMAEDWSTIIEECELIATAIREAAKEAGA